jgi:hypothetical protein
MIVGSTRYNGAEIMQSPPYYSSAPKKSNVGLIVGIIVIAVILCCVAPMVGLGVFGLNIFNKAQGFMGCGWSLEQMRDGMLAYAKAHDGKLPAKDHWQEDIAQYLKPIPIQKGMKLPPMNSDVCDLDAGSSACYNEGLAGKNVSSIKDPSSTVILWEVPGRGRDKSGPYTEPVYTTGPKLVGNIPRGWITQPVEGEAHYMANPQGMQQPIPYPEKGGGAVHVDVGTGAGTTGSSGN